jgi:hypothetical protein
MYEVAKDLAYKKTKSSAEKAGPLRASGTWSCTRELLLKTLLFLLNEHTQHDEGDESNLMKLPYFHVETDKNEVHPCSSARPPGKVYKGL